MLDPLNPDNNRILGLLSRRRSTARGILLLEKITEHGWRLFFWSLLFCGLWMLGIPAFFGLNTEILVLLLFLLGCAYFVIKDLLTFKIPSPSDIDKRLEADNQIIQGSIRTLSDTLANPKKSNTRELWSIGQSQILQTLLWLHIKEPKAVIVRKDPHALRFIALLLFITGFLWAGADSQHRVVHGLMPFMPDIKFSQEKNINLWIKPPQYTGASQIHLSGAKNLDTPLIIPEGSEIKARYQSSLGQFFTPYFDKEPMKNMGENLYGLDTIIKRHEKLKIIQGLIPVANWPYTYLDDEIPSIHSDTNEDQKDSFIVLPNGQIRFPLSVIDDYGVADLLISVHLDPIVEEKPIGNTYTQTRLIMSPRGEEFKIAPVYDLSWHSWAGLPVNILFQVRDHIGQSAVLKKISLTLPERDFTNPVAKSLIAVRKKLAWSKTYDFTQSANDLASLLTAKNFFKNSSVPYLAIKTASTRLVQSEGLSKTRKLETAQAVMDLLWDTAIALEDGTLALALRDLKDAQNALEQALGNPQTPPEEIQKLMNDLQEKIQNYFAELQKEMQKRMAEGQKFPTFSPDQFGQMINPDSLSQFLEKMKSELESGDKEKAQEMLSQLQRMMDMMDPSLNTPMPKDMQMMAKGVNELQELIDRQEKLMAQTQKQAEKQTQLDSFSKRQQPPPEFQELLKKFGMDKSLSIPRNLGNKNSKNIDTSKNKAEQESLRYILGQLMMEAGENLDKIPENMGKAEQEMRGSAESLGNNDPENAIPHQEKTIKHLKESQEELNKQLQQRMQKMVGIGLSGGMNYDPLGRPFGGRGQKNGPLGDQKIEIPDENQKKRAEEILRLLRDRSGEFDRPEDELDYFRRLLRQF